MGYIPGGSDSARVKKLVNPRFTAFWCRGEVDEGSSVAILLLFSARNYFDFVTAWNSVITVLDSLDDVFVEIVFELFKSEVSVGCESGGGLKELVSELP